MKKIDQVVAVVTAQVVIARRFQPGDPGTLSHKSEIKLQDVVPDKKVVRVDQLPETIEDDRFVGIDKTYLDDVGSVIDEH